MTKKVTKKRTILNLIAFSNFMGKLGAELISYGDTVAIFELKGLGSVCIKFDNNEVYQTAWEGDDESCLTEMQSYSVEGYCLVHDLKADLP